MYTDEKKRETEQEEKRNCLSSEKGMLAEFLEVCTQIEYSLGSRYIQSKVVGYQNMETPE